MIINYASSIINKLKALLTDDARVVIYDRHVFIVQATVLYGDSKMTLASSAKLLVKTKIINFCEV
jgi:hypothetical protein